jgi:hypothetical protein
MWRRRVEAQTGVSMANVYSRIGAKDVLEVSQDPAPEVAGP